MKFGTMARLCTMIGQTRLIRVKLSLIFVFFFLMVILMGCFGIWSLSRFNEVSSDIRDHWMQSIQILGDLNNFTSDLRTAEGSGLLSSNAEEIARSEKEIENLQGRVSQARANYQTIRHDSRETALYIQFENQWSEYDKTRNQVMALLRRGHRVDGIALYQGASRLANNAASDALDRLTDYTVDQARQASRRSEQAYLDTRRLIAMAMSLAGLMVVAVLVYIRRSLSRPLLDLAACMHRLAGFAATEIDIPSTARADEIGEMARAVVVFRDNTIELAVSQRGLAQQASMLKEKLAEEQRLTLLQRNFVSMASHEFRTPLTIIDAHAQRLLKMKDRLTADDIGARVGAIREAVQRISSLIENLLESARLVDGDVGLYYHPAETDLANLLHEVCQWFRQISPRSQIVEVIKTKPLTMTGDPALLFQAFSNLLANAIKYSPDGSLVTVTAHSDSQWITVSVKDAGIGIPEKDRDRIFECYFRGSNVAAAVGTGVGLFFVKMAVTLHGGSISIETKEEMGSTFSLRLPVGPPA